jgi:hypothetical protein
MFVDEIGISSRPPVQFTAHVGITPVVNKSTRESGTCDLTRERCGLFGAKIEFDEPSGT